MGKKARRRAKAKRRKQRERREQWEREDAIVDDATEAVRLAYANANAEVLAATAGLRRALSKLRLAESHLYMTEGIGGDIVTGRLDRYHVELRDLLVGLADETAELRMYTHGLRDGDTVAYWRMHTVARRLMHVQFQEIDEHDEYKHLYDPLIPGEMFGLSVACAEEKLAMAKSGTPIEEIEEAGRKHGGNGRSGCPTGKHAAADVGQWEGKLKSKKWRKKAAKRLDEERRGRAAVA